MASYKYTYPRVDITTTALSRPVLTENVPDTLVLFAPFKANIGPLNKIVVCHSLEEFETTFGTIDYVVLGQNGLNIQHWLRSGGTVYAARVGTAGTDSGNNLASATVSSSSITFFKFTTKNPGSGYNDFKVQLSKYTDSSMMVNIFFGSVQMERFVLDSNVFAELSDTNNTISEFVYIIKNTDMTGETFDTDKKLSSAITGLLTSPKTISFEDGATEETSQDELIKNALTAPTDANANESDFRKLLKDSLQYPIDVILDAGFATDTKNAIWNAFNSADTNANHIRNDVFVYYDAFEFSTSSVQPSIPASNSFYDSIIATGSTNTYRTSPNAHNAAIYQQFYKVKDPYINTQIFVTPSYFISTMLPYQTISLNKGYHTPIAGLTNGELSGVLYLNQNPVPSDKETWFTARVNYAEKDSRQISFMSQRTLENGANNSALQFINNALMTNIIVKELGILAREYLFEYNDAITLSNLRKTLNTYITNYVASRVLEYAYIDVQKDEFSPEAIDVSINIKYTGTIEVISIDLTIE